MRQFLKKKRINPNVLERAGEARDKGGGIFNSSRGNQATTYEFSTSNVLWRASLQVLDFIPLNNVDYSGGVIVTDWYSSEDSKESIKFTIRFLSSELQASSVNVKSFNRICNIQNICSTKKGSEELNQKIKSSILEKAREIKLKDDRKK